MGEGIIGHQPAEALHELRKKGKELRYMLELFGVPLHSAEVARPDGRPAQGAPGRARPPSGSRGPDRPAAPLAAEVATLPGGPSAVLAMGMLVERLASDAAAAREELAGVPWPSSALPSSGTRQGDLSRIPFPTHD